MNMNMNTIIMHIFCKTTFDHFSYFSLMIISDRKQNSNDEGKLVKDGRPTPPTHAYSSSLSS